MAIVGVKIAAAFCALTVLTTTVAQIFTNPDNTNCPAGWTTVDSDDPLVADLTDDAFLTWLVTGSPLTANISCDANTTNTYDLGIYTACQQGSAYEILVEADFSCFYNETPYLLPAISDPNAVLNDTVLLDVQVRTQEATSATSAGDEVDPTSTSLPLASHDDIHEIVEAEA